MAKMFRTAAFAALIVAGPLGGCADQAGTPPGFGASVRANIAAQVDNPNPDLTTGPIGSDGKRVGDAYSRYATGRVYQPTPAFQTIHEGQAAPAPLPAN